MRKILNDCVCCDLPCIDCGRKHVEHIFCDCCEVEIGLDGFSYKNGEFCLDCLHKLLINEFLKGTAARRCYLKSLGDDADYCGWVDSLSDEDLEKELLDQDIESLINDFDVEVNEISW